MKTTKDLIEELRKLLHNSKPIIRFPQIIELVDNIEASLESQPESTIIPQETPPTKTSPKSKTPPKPKPTTPPNKNKK